MFRGGAESTFPEWVAEQLDSPERTDSPTRVGENVAFEPFLASFTVGEDGSVDDIHMRNGDSLLCSKIQTILEESPVWTPAYRRKKPIETSYFLIKRSPEGALELLPEDEAERVMPTFNGGGIDEFRTWVTRNVVYPPQALRNGAHGTVKVEFRINRQGETEFSELISSPNVILTTETVRIIISSPRWTAGTIEGIPVEVYYVLPIVFSPGGTTRPRE
jgi:hypothetical protein